MAESVAVHVLTHDSRRYLEPCLQGVLAQTRPPDRLRFIDCASTDGTPAWLGRHAAAAGAELIFLDRNRGYAGGHNAGLRQAREDFVLLLNPDVRLEPGFLKEALGAMARHPGAGAVSGKLLRADDTLEPEPGPVLDSTGIVMTRTQRHLDRGAGCPDAGLYEREEEIFGASGAAPLYRRAMLEDIAVDGQIFDEDFFAYREDVDLAWRARLLGWRAIYAPRARALHHRRARPGERRGLPPDLRCHSVKNRFLMRMKNQTWSNLWRTLPGLGTDLALIGYVLAAERSSLPGLRQVLRQRREALAKRRQIMARRRVAGWQVDRWFVATPHRSGTVRRPRT